MKKMILKRYKKANNDGIAISGVLYSILILFLALVFGILALLSSTKYTFDKLKDDVQKELNGTSSDFCYEFDYGSGTILNYYEMLNGCGKQVVIPDEIEGVSVLSIAAGAFYNKGIELVDFSSATKLRTIKGGESPVEGAFANNKIKQITFGADSVIETIGNYAFYNNQIEGTLHLSDLPILTAIGADAFAKNNITKLDVSDLTLLKSIDDMAFYGNSITGTIDFSKAKNLKTIGIGAFASNSITRVKTDGLEKLELIDNYAFHANSIEEFDFDNLKSLKEIGRGSFSYNQLGVADFTNTKVEKIKERAFEYNAITSVSFKDTVTSIGDYAFFHNQIEGILDLSMIQTNLTGDSIFAINNITKLKYNGTTIPKGLLAHNKVTSVTNEDIPNVATIGLGAFVKNKTLTTVDLSSSGSLSFGAMSFSMCDISDLKLPKTSTLEFHSVAFTSNKISGTLDFSNNPYVWIGSRAFRENQLTGIILPSSSSRYVLKEGVFTLNNLEGDSAFIMSGTTLVAYAGPGGDITIPEGVETIGLYALMSSGITHINFASTIKRIEEFSIGGNNLEGTLDLTPMKNLTFTGRYAFASVLYEHSGQTSTTEECKLYDSATDSTDRSAYLSDLTSTCKKSSTMNYGTGSWGHPTNTKTTAIDFTGLTKLGNINSGCFQNFEGNLELIGTKDLSSLTTISHLAFKNNKSLERGIDFSGSPNLATIGEEAFRDHHYQDEINLSGTKIITISKSAFHTTDNGSHVTKVILPSTVGIIDERAFYWTKLDSINLQDGLASIGAWAFYQCNLKGDLKIPRTVVTIGAAAFRDIHSNGTLELPNNLKTIGDQAFYTGAFIGTIKVPASVTSLGYSAFGWNGFTKIDLSEFSLKEIPFKCFAHSRYATEIVFNDKIETIKKEAFYGNLTITSVTIPANIKSIDSNAFGNSDKLTNVTIEYNDTNPIDRFNSTWNNIGFGKANMPAYGYSTYTLSTDSSNLFDSTHNVYQVLINQSGYYRLEAWGAQGGSYSSKYRGGYGGYAAGTFYLPKDTYVYIFVGTQPTKYYESSVGRDNPGGFNGGGIGLTGEYATWATTYAMGGGGATDFRIGTSQSLYSRIVVAGGGSGSTNYKNGYAGGGTSSKGGNSTYIATQTKAGVGGSFGYGASVIADRTKSDFAGAGGGGWYGGGTTKSSSSYATVTHHPQSFEESGGGSSYVYSKDTAASYPSGCLVDSSFYAADGTTEIYSGDDVNTNGERLGNTGDGHARITYIGTTLNN